MRKYFINILMSLVISFFYSCGSQDCSLIENDFDSYANALKIIKSSKFKFYDTCDTSSSSWISDAQFLSCDGKTGFLLVGIKSKTYIHLEVPIEKWKKFKSAESFGKYYNTNIKSKFRLIL